MSNDSIWLVNKIEEISAPIIADCETFTLLRHYKDKSDFIKGGGNILQSLGLFSLLNFYSKVYWLLADSKNVPLSKESVDNNKRILKTINEKNSLISPREGSINEKDCFLYLVNNLLNDQIFLFPSKSQVLLTDNGYKFLLKHNPKSVVEDFRNLLNSVGFNNKDKESVWNSFRNGLAHIAQPRSQCGIVTLFYGESVSEDLLKLIYNNGSQYSFYRNGPGYICIVEYLMRDINLIRNSLRSFIENGEFSEENIRKTQNWLKLQLL